MGAAVSVMRKHKITDARRDLGAEARAVEHAVMADVRLFPMYLVLGRDVHAQVVRGPGLADRRDIIVLTLNRH